MGYGLDNPIFDTWWEKETLLFSPKRPDGLRSTQPPIQWVPGLFPRRETGLVMRLTTRAPYTAQAMNDWSYTSTLHIRLHGVDRGNVTFYMIIIT